MRGIKDFNFPTFFAFQAILEDLGYDVFNPAEKDLRKYGSSLFKSEHGDTSEIVGSGFDLRQAFGDDMATLCRWADAIILLPGWEKSKGARAERAVAETLGLEIYEGYDVETLC